MRALRYSINVTLDECCDHRAILPDEDLHRHAAENIEQADALLFGRVTYEMMEAAWRPVAQTGVRAAKVEAGRADGQRFEEAKKRGAGESSDLAHLVGARQDCRSTKA